MNQTLSCLTNSGFNVQAAVFLAHAAELAYEQNVTIVSNWAKHQGFDSATTFNRGNVQGFWTTTPTVALLTFRGTNNLGQWLRNAHLLPSNDLWGRVHSGFAKGIANADEDLRGFEDAAARAEHVWVTGHSLGGALAVLASARLKRKGISSHVYTFGQPRVGFREFAERFEGELPGRLWRFINQSDIVARVPPGVFYRHVGQVKRIVRPGILEAIGLDDLTPAELIESDLPPVSDAEFDALLEQLDAHPEAATLDGVSLEGRCSLFSDHSMLEYIRLLTDIRDQQG